MANESQQQQQQQEQLQQQARLRRSSMRRMVRFRMSSGSSTADVDPNVAAPPGNTLAPSHVLFDFQKTPKNSALYLNIIFLLSLFYYLSIHDWTKSHEKNQSTVTIFSYLPPLVRNKFEIDLNWKTGNRGES